MTKPNREITDEEARAVLEIDKNDWVISVTDAELGILKAAVRLHADMSENLAVKIEEIG